MNILSSPTVKYTSTVDIVITTLVQLDLQVLGLMCVDIAASLAPKDSRGRGDVYTLPPRYLSFFWYSTVHCTGCEGVGRTELGPVFSYHTIMPR